MRKRLLIVSQHYWPENFRVTDLAEGFSEDDIGVDVLCGLPNYPAGEWFQGYSEEGPFEESHNSVHLFRCKEIPRLGNSSRNIFLNYVSWPWYASRAIKRLPGDYDAVLCYCTSPVLMIWPAMHASRRFGAELTTYVLDLWPENLYSVLNIKNRFLRSIALGVSNYLYRRSDNIIAISDGMRDNLMSRVGTVNARGCVSHDKRYCVVPQYCEDFYASTSDEQLETADHTYLNIFFAGNLSPAQGLDTAINALGLLRDRGMGPDDIRLTIVGDGMSLESLRELTSSLSLESQVKFVGRVAPEEIPNTFLEADALLVSLARSNDLGLTIPAKLASCMASRKPLLVSLDGEGAQAAQECGGALVSPAGDVDLLAGNMLRMAAKSSEERASMGDRCYSYYEKNYRRSLLLGRMSDFIFGTRQ